MEKPLFDFFKAFTDSPSPSGFETPAQRVWREYVAGHVDEVTTDVMGNTCGIVDTGSGPRVMLAGHCDEVGLMVRYIDDDGYIFFAPVGGVDAHLLPGSRVNLHTDSGTLRGIIGRKPIHMLEPEERKKVAKLKELFIDIGAADGEEAKKLVSIGDVATFAAEVERLQGDNVAGRAFDDKMGAMIVAEVLRRVAERKSELSCSVYGVSTVQEEVGLRGATVSAFDIDPEVGICVEVTFATDFPTVDKKTIGDVKLGRGPVLSRGPNINHKLFDMLRATADELDIPLQYEAAPRGTSTDANVMQLTRSGVATALVEVPLRYMHTSGEVLNLSDLDNAIELITGLLLRIDGSEDWVVV